MNKYTAIMLASRDIREYDRLYAMYTFERGLIWTVAKGVRKPSAKLAGHLEPGTLSEVYVARSKGRGRITSAITLSDYPGTRSDFDKLSGLLKIFSFILKVFSEEEKDEKIFLLLSDFLDILEEEDFSSRGNLIALGFWWKLLSLLGQEPEVMRCVDCRKALEVGRKKFFSVEKGGVSCETCSSGRENFPIGDDQIKMIRIFLTNPFRKISKIRANPEDIRRLIRIKDDFLRYNFS